MGNARKTHMAGRGMAVVQFPGLMAAVLLLAMLGMAACGGDKAAGPRESNLTLTPVASHVDPGSNQALLSGSLKVRTSAGTAVVDRDGAVSTQIFEEGPQFAELLDSRGRTVMMAFVSPAEPDFSVLSTARALAYLSLAGPWLLEEGRLQLLDEVDNVAGFLPLLAAVQAQVDAQGYLDLEAAGIQQAIQSMIAAVQAASLSHDHVKPMGVLATPTTASGLSLDTTVDGKLTVENTYLRRVSLFFRRVSHLPAVGEEVDETNAFTRIDMPNVARYAGITGTIDSYFQGEVAYSPVKTEPPLDIPRFPADARRTTYQIFAIGPGLFVHPALNVPADIIAAQQVLEMKALFLDAFMVLLANVALPLKGEQVDEFLEFASANAVVTDIIGNLKSTLPDVWEQAAAGDYLAALQTLIASAYTSNTILPAMAQVTLDFLWKNTGINQDDYDMLFNGMKGMLDKMGKIDIGFTLADTFLLFRDIGDSYKIEHFLVTTTPGKVTLVTARDELLVSESTAISATVQDRDPSGVYEFNWSVSPAANYWLDDRNAGTQADSSGVLVTSESTVDIRSLVSTQGVAVVTCRVFRIDGGRREVGDSNISVTFTRSNLVVQTRDDFQVATTVVPTSDGGFIIKGGLYMDFSEEPRLAGASQYLVERVARDGDREHVSLDGSNLNQPIRSEYTIDSEFSAGSLRQRLAPELLGQVGAGSIRVWFEDRSTGYGRNAEAEASVSAFKSSWITSAKSRKVTVSVRYPE